MPAPILQISDELIINWWNITRIERSQDESGAILIWFAGEVQHTRVEEPQASEVVKYMADIGESLVSKTDTEPQMDASSRFGNLMGGDE